MKELQYECPWTVEAAVALLAQGESRVLAGGTDLVAQMREGRRSVSRVIDVKRIPQLTRIEFDDKGGVVIGAAVPVAEVARHAHIAERYAGLVDAARMIGSLQIQSRATLGGNICNGAPSADASPALMVLGATARVAGPRGTRSAPLEALFKGPGQTTLAPDELLLCLVLPPLPARSASAYVRFTPRREMDIAVAGVATRIALAPGSRRIEEAHLALASVAPVPLRARAAERALIGHEASPEAFAEAGRLAASEAQPISDTRGSAEYRLELTALLAGRSLAAACRRLDVEIAVP